MSGAVHWIGEVDVGDSSLQDRRIELALARPRRHLAGQVEEEQILSDFSISHNP